MATAVKKRPAPRSIRPVKGANFEPKSVRKAARKKLIAKAGLTGNLRNVVADARLSAAERAAFYRNLRQMKMSRRRISGEMARLSAMVKGLQREIGHVYDRYTDVDAGLLEEATMLTKTANASVSAAADEFYTFSRKRVFYTQAVPA